MLEQRAALPYLTVLSDVGPLEWCGVVSRTLIGIEMSGSDRSVFAGDLRVRSVRGVRLSEVTARPCHARSRCEERDARPAYMLCYQLSGAGSIWQDSRSVNLNAGDLAMYATTRTSELVFGEQFRAISLRVPADLLDIPPSRADRLGATLFPASEGLAPVLGAYLARFGGLLDSATPTSREQAVRTGIGLFATMLRAHLDDASPTSESTGAGLLRLQIVDHIDEQLGDPTLSPVGIAKSLHISVRHLHKLFENGESVGTYVRRRRLERCERDLLDPALQRDPVAVIARRWGFESASHFGQLFRQHYGTTPAVFRQTAMRPNVADRTVHARDMAVR